MHISGCSHAYLRSAYAFRACEPELLASILLSVTYACALSVGAILSCSVSLIARCSALFGGVSLPVLLRNDSGSSANAASSSLPLGSTNW